MIHPVVVNPVLSPVVRVTDPVRWRAGKLAPADTFLYFDADIDPYAEQTGGPHTFNHNVLGPQYQRNADGSYVNVGAKPAVDVFDGEKWLRSCGAVTNLFGGDTSQARSVSLTNGTVYTLHVFGEGAVSCPYGTATVEAPLKITATATASVTFTPTGATYWMLTATAYPVPYVPPGATQPASNATTTNGVWFALPDGSPLWQALTGQPLTLATRVRMGVGSADLPQAVFTNLSIVAADAFNDSAQSALGRMEGTPQLVRAYDKTNSSAISTTWSRNFITRRITQVNTAGTQFRVGYMIEGTNTSIQWSAWVNFDGSFNPSTLYRLMLGYNNAYPMWFNKITAWKKQATDAEILEAMA